MGMEQSGGTGSVDRAMSLWGRVSVVCCLLAVAGTALALPLGANGSTLPDAPLPQTTQSAPAQQPPPAKPGQTGDRTYSLSKAEHQRILGVIPAFSVVTDESVYKPLTPKQKFQLFWKGTTDPYIFILDGFVAGIGQAKDSNPGYGQGAEGYFKRYGAAYADTFDGNFWGNAVLTSALHEDPRYFRQGSDSGHSYTHRAVYSALTAVWSRKDSGSYGPNFANILGNIIAGGISNVYYPSADRGVGKTFTGAITVTAEGTIGSELQEFIPDIQNHFLRKRREKRARQGQTP